jgi:hypothetical protein
VPKGFKRGDEGFEAAADALLEKVIEELQGLYDRHKEEYGWQDRPLSIE